MKNKSTILSLGLGSILLLGSAAAVASDIQANNCEIFIDALQLGKSSHGSKNFRVYVKTLNNRLDAPIKKVGFAGHSVNSWQYGASQTNIDQELTLTGGDNYFILFLSVSSDYGHSDYSGAFYVTTEKGTTYWAHGSVDNGNVAVDFTFDSNAFDSKFPSNSWGPAVTVNTQNGAYGGYYNMHNCY